MRSRSIGRGDVVLADLAEAGGRLRKIRPAIVVQNNVGNRASPETIVIGIRSPGRGEPLPVCVRVSAGTGGLRKDSEIDAGQILTLRKRALGPTVGRMPPEVMAKVDTALKKSLALD